MISPLKILANIQLEYTDHIIVGCVLLTALMATGIPNIELQTDFQSSLPDTLDPIATQDKVEANFGSSDAIIVLFETDSQPIEEGFVTDIRDPDMIRTLNFLENQLQNEPSISSVNSMASMFEQTPDSKKKRLKTS